MNIVELLFVFLFIVIAIILFYFAFRYFMQLKFAKNPSTSNTAVKGKNICPICHSLLEPGENIRSRVYTEEKSKEQSCIIQGCPHCYPKADFGIKRECPVCHKTIPQTGHLRAILFTRESEKKHVHVVGCTECQRRRL